MLCPKDNIVCDPKQLQDVEIDVCPKCDGVWLEQKEVRNLVRHFSIPEYSNVDELMDEWEVTENQGTAPKDFWSEGKLMCPKDGAQMQKHYFAGSRIGVDQCQVCKGFWLDGGELKAVAKYFEPNPSLDRAWQMVLQDKKEWDRELAELATFPASVAAWIASPFLGVTVIGSFFLRMLIENLTEREVDLYKTTGKRPH